MNEFMLAAMIWISTFVPNWNVPALPDVKYANHATLQYMLYGCGNITEERGNKLVCSGEAETVGKTLAIYNNDTKTIWLRDNLKETLSDIVYKSVIVHELVHHMQYSNKGKYACMGKREIEAYEIQDEWLKAQDHVGVMEALDLNGLYMATMFACPYDGYWVPQMD